MADDQITYQMIRAVRDETGASHDESRRVLEEVGGDVAAAAALWFARQGQGAAPASGCPSPEPHLQNAPPSGRS